MKTPSIEEVEIGRPISVKQEQVDDFVQLGIGFTE